MSELQKQYEQVEKQIEKMLEDYDPNEENLPLIPAGYRVLVKQDLVSDKTDTGIIKHTAKEHRRKQKGKPTGVLMAVGPMAWQGERFGGVPWAEVGQRVRFGRYAGQAFSVNSDGTWWQVMNDEDILGVIPEGIETTEQDD